TRRGLSEWDRSILLLLEWSRRERDAEYEALQTGIV
ncbi:unnamed protein product, partial [marine sediment metagenome]